MNRSFFVAAAFIAPLALTGCKGLPVPSVITEPKEVQSACTLITLAVPIAEKFRSNLGAAEAALLDSAELALSHCAEGNATAAVLDVAEAIEKLLAKRGTTRAMLLRRVR